MDNLYRAIDACGDTIEFLLRKRRNAAAAKAFFSKAFKSKDITKKVVIDKSALLSLSSILYLLPIA